MKRLRVLVLTHVDLVPPDTLDGQDERTIQSWKKEYDVAHGLRELGHEVQVLGVSDDLLPIRQHVEGFRPHVVFHLLMEFQDVAVYQAHVVSYLELLRVSYAGCIPRGLLLARDKALARRSCATTASRCPASRCSGAAARSGCRGGSPIRAS